MDRDFLTALDGVEAEVIELDYMMPEMSGADLAREIRRRVPRQKIIIVSGYAEAEAFDALADSDPIELRKPSPPPSSSPPSWASRAPPPERSRLVCA